jgi:ferredoxin
MRTLPLEGHRGNQEVELGCSIGEIEISAPRCYLCNYKFEIEKDKCIHCDQCIRCGNCNRACPTYAIPIRRTDMVRSPS